MASCGRGYRSGLSAVKKMRVIQLEKPHPQWPEDFAKEVDVIKAIFADSLIAAYPIGSTAIRGIRAKPVIDILLEVRALNEIEKYNEALESLGYEAKGEYGIKGRRFFQKGQQKRTHHLHLFESGNPEIERHRLFVAFMNAHPDRAAEYEKLKIALANQYREAPEQYAQGKSVFIRAMDEEAVQWRNR